MSKYPSLRYKLHTDLRAAINQAKQILDSDGLSFRFPVDVSFSAYLVTDRKGHPFETGKMTHYKPDHAKIESAYQALSEKLLDLYDPAISTVEFKDISMNVEEHRALTEKCPVCKKVLTASMRPARHIRR
jgi:hypothetical protein